MKTIAKNDIVLMDDGSGLIIILQGHAVDGDRRPSDVTKRISVNELRCPRSSNISFFVSSHF